MDYSPKGLSHACEVEKTFTEFFHAVKAVLRSTDEKAPQRWEEVEKKLAEALYQVTRRGGGGRERKRGREGEREGVGISINGYGRRKIKCMKRL